MRSVAIAATFLGDKPAMLDISDVNSGIPMIEYVCVVYDMYCDERRF